MNRTFLFLLVVGLFVVAWQRNKGQPAAPPMRPAPASGPKPAVVAPTNYTADRTLVSVGQSIHK